MEQYKQVIIVRDDLKLPKGKMAAQCAHAAVEAALKSSDSNLKAWRAEGQKKVILKADNEKHLRLLNQAAKDMGMKTALITDAGKTVIAPGTVTCLAIGPDEETQIDTITNKLKLM